MNSHLGANGDNDNDFCVGDPWTKEQYTTDSVCATDETAGDCCLKRWHSDNTTLVSRNDVSDAIFMDKKYNLYKPFIIKMVDSLLQYQYLSLFLLSCRAMHPQLVIVDHD